MIMVLGLKAKNRRSPSVHVDYVIHIQEIKPWPPSQSLRTLRAVLIQWEHGERNSGSTNQVVPSLGTGSGVGDGRIEFNESFRLPVVLLRELSAKGGDRETFQKNCIEFNLYEPRRDKTGQLLGTAVVDFADHGIVEEPLCISAAINCKRTYRNTAQPLLFLKIQCVERSKMNSSTRDRLMREPSMDRNEVDSVSALMNEEYAEEAETASYSDDDISSHSSVVVSSSAADSNGGSPPQNNENGLEGARNSSIAGSEYVPTPKRDLAKEDDNQLIESNASSKGNSSLASSMDLSSDLAWITKKIGSCTVQSPSSSSKHEETEVPGVGHTNTITSEGQSSEASTPSGPLKKDIFSNLDVMADEKSALMISKDNHTHGHLDNTAKIPSTGLHDCARNILTQEGDGDCERRQGHKESGEQVEFVEEEEQSIEDEQLCRFSQDESRKQVSLESDALSPSQDFLALKDAPQNTDRFRHLKSVRSPIDSNRNNASVRVNPYVSGGMQNGSPGLTSSMRKDSKVHPKETRNTLLDNKIQLLEQRVKALEGELREAAAIEVGLYSVIAEHGSSKNKVHAPARRLSRFYLHACKANSQSGAGRAAKSAVSGLILVAKSCGNDVPRLTFWLSNTIVLRAIISESLGEMQLVLPAGPATQQKVNRNRDKKSSPIKWQPLSTKGMKGSQDWEDPQTFKSGLENVEAWIFSRIIESIWWQTFTPQMQSAAAKMISKDVLSDPSKKYRRTLSSNDQEQCTFSMELWKNAFRDACERICPVRAEGHQCGCLPILPRLIMEQCVARLDVAMFNAILRESADDIPTDPVSDPIGDAEVLPIPAGRASFGAGAQLKNAIGNWSRWLTDLFGIDDEDEELREVVKGSDESSDDERPGKDASLKSFHLLNALSDLMMLPKDMLLSKTIRKEVCPTFGPALIRRVLNTFVPDEFCPDPIPKVVLEALNSEDSFEDKEDSVVNFPCAAASIVYAPPSAASVAGFLGDAGKHSQLTRKGSLVLTKSYTSDDELDELDSPLSSVINDSTHVSPSTKLNWTSKGNSGQHAVRYQLLREVWKNSD